MVPKWVVFDGEGFQVEEFKRHQTAVNFLKKTAHIQRPKSIAWATKSAKSQNGKILQWSRVHRTVFMKYALCGVPIPSHTKWRVGNEAATMRGKCAICFNDKNYKFDL